jgi:anionic cell wall polymer biosynthesis LytR-Cps2A-Psr (LCP) family protein
LSGVRIDAYVVVDFSGFAKVVDAIGGLEVNLLCEIRSSAANLYLPAGVNEIDGMTALGLARARKGSGLGDMSDLGRIRRQQALFEAIWDKVITMNIITDFPRLYNLVGSVIESVTTDLGSNLAEIAGFAYSLKGMKMDAISFTTPPLADAGNHRNVVIVEHLAEPMWSAIRQDIPLPKKEEDPGEEAPTAQPSPPSAPTYGPPAPTPTIYLPVTIQTEEDCW